MSRPSFLILSALAAKIDLLRGIKSVIVTADIKPIDDMAFAARQPWTTHPEQLRVPTLAHVGVGSVRVT